MVTHQKEVLIVDDDLAMRLAMKKIFEADGLRVFEANSVPAAFTFLENRSPHLIFLDVIMPDTNGFVLLEEWKKTKKLQNIPIIISSVVGHKTLITKAMALGATDYIVKPFSASTLIHKTKKALKQQVSALHRFSQLQKPNVRATLPGKITAISEIGYLAETSAKLARNSIVDMYSQILSDMGAIDYPKKIVSYTSKQTEPGQYIHKIIFIGISETVAKKIRKRTRNWK